MSNGSNAPRTTGNKHYCLKKARVQTMNCGYATQAECNKFAGPSQANCVVNPKFAGASGKSTTGASGKSK